MPHYMLSVHADASTPREPMTETQMKEFMQRVGRLEEEMESRGAWVFSARLDSPDTATVVRMAEREVLSTDGPFVESKEHIAGFYVIAAADLDEALEWGSKVTDAVKQPIEVRPIADYRGG